MLGLVRVYYFHEAQNTDRIAQFWSNKMVELSLKSGVLWKSFKNIFIWLV